MQGVAVQSEFESQKKKNKKKVKPPRIVSPLTTTVEVELSKTIFAQNRTSAMGKWNTKATTGGREPIDTAAGQ
jgi:hypothetical protein